MRAFIYGAFALLIWVSAPASASEQQVKQFAIKLADDAIEILENPDLSDGGKQRNLETLFDKHVDIDWVSRFVLGKHWRQASDSQRNTYQKHYKDFILKNYTGRLKAYKGQEYTVKNVRNDGDDEYTVTLELLNPSEPSILLDYRIHNTSSGLQIYDIIVEGVSMITTQRSEFDSVITRKGLDFLIGALEKRAKRS